MSRISATKSSGNVFRDIGFDEAEAAELLAKSELISALARAIKARGLTQKQAAKLCRTDQPTLSKILRGRMESVTMDLLSRWLVALGRNVEIAVGKPKRRAAKLTVRAA